jgi:hypothetical protein
MNFCKEFYQKDDENWKLLGGEIFDKDDNEKKLIRNTNKYQSHITLEILSTLFSPFLFHIHTWFPFLIFHFFFFFFFFFFLQSYIFSFNFSYQLFHAWDDMWENEKIRNALKKERIETLYLFAVLQITMREVNEYMVVIRIVEDMCWLVKFHKSYVYKIITLAPVNKLYVILTLSLFCTESIS